MFDDQQPQPGSPSVSKKSAPPEDIFSDVDTTPVSTPPVQPPPAPAPVSHPPKERHVRAEDISVPPPTNKPSQAFSENAPLPAGLSDETFSRPPEPIIREQERMGSGGHSATAKKMLVVGVIAVLVVIAAVLLTSLILRSRKAVSPLSQPTAVPAPTVTTPIEDLVPLTTTLPEEEPLPLAEEDRAPVVVSVDSDRDGLTDEEELALGTSPRSADTDADGLSDRDEVEQWGTNPLNPDTDGDSFTDGDEVDNGYNPRGGGKLFEIPTE